MDLKIWSGITNGATYQSDKLYFKLNKLYFWVSSHDRFGQLREVFDQRIWTVKKILETISPEISIYFFTNFDLNLTHTQILILKLHPNLTQTLCYL